MEIKVNWKALKKLGLTPASFHNGCCPEMAAVIRSLIPNSKYMVGIGIEKGEDPFLSHVVVYDPVTDTTYDADGYDAITNWENDIDYDVHWEEVTEEDELDRMVFEHFGSIEENTIDKIRPHVKVVA